MSYQEMKDNKEIYENFMSIVPSNHLFGEYTVGPIKLSVISTNGIAVTPDVKITVNDLNSGEKRFINNSGKGDKFKVNVIISRDATVQGVMSTKQEMQYGYYHGMYGWYGGGTIIHHKQIRITDALEYWIKNMNVFLVTTRAIDVPNGKYIITSNPSRKQNYENYTVWELEFTKFFEGIPIKATWDDTYANKAVETYKNKKAKKAKATKDKAKKSESNVSKLKKCKVGKGSEIKYSKTKKVTECVKLMQWVLKKKGYYDKAVSGWFDDYTLKCVKNFQTDYNKKKKKGKYTKKDLLRTDGKVDKYVLAALCKA